MSCVETKAGYINIIGVVGRRPAFCRGRRNALTDESRNRGGTDMNACTGSCHLEMKQASTQKPRRNTM